MIVISYEHIICYMATLKALVIRGTISPLVIALESKPNRNYSVKLRNAILHGSEEVPYKSTISVAEPQFQNLSQL